MLNKILIEHGYLPAPAPDDNELSIQAAGTLVSNIAYYGYAPSSSVLESLLSSSDKKVAEWWLSIKDELVKVTGSDKDIGAHIVYKNFPKEVLDMTNSQYVFNQICMYSGYPNELFAQPEEERKPLNEKLSLKVLHLSNERTVLKIQESILSQPARWSNKQLEQIVYLSVELGLPVICSSIPFKENMATIANVLIKKGIELYAGSATDVLRIGAAMSDGDPSLRTNTKFRNFTRKERRAFLSMLEKQKDSYNDYAARPEVWKRFLRNLHPGDYKDRYPTVVAYQEIICSKKKMRTFDSTVETFIREKESRVIKMLALKPGVFLRRLQKVVSVFGMEAALVFGDVVVPKLSIMQVLKLKKYLENINVRSYRTFPPKGVWRNLKIVENNIQFDEECQEFILLKIKERLRDLISSEFPNGVTLDLSSKLVKLKDNDSTLTDYGRGTRFPIPENINFIRTASYWECKRGGQNTWFDNGFNFFDEEWKSLKGICWNSSGNVFSGGALFSGDPTNSKSLKGEAGQMIDLDLEKLKKNGVRYAVWSILCYSKIPFSDAEHVAAYLQWGEEKQEGELFEPSRCQMFFPLTGNKLTSYVAYIDLELREIVYIDVSFGGSVQSALSNSNLLSKKMTAFEEYLETLPSVYDLFEYSEPGNDVLVSFSDAEYKLEGQKAFVFRPEVSENDFQQIDLNNILTK